MHNRFRWFLVQTLLILLLHPGIGHCQVQRIDPEFLRSYGADNFSQQYKDALWTYLQAEEKYSAGEFPRAHQLLENLWAQYPVGSPGWGALPGQPFGINLGTPPCYYALRMLTDMTTFRLEHPPLVHRVVGGQPGEAVNLPPRSALLTIVVVGETSGIEPRTVLDIQQGTGPFVVHSVDPRLTENSHFAVRESLALFKEYTTAITRGRLGLRTHILPLPGAQLPVRAQVLPGGTYHAGLTNLADVWSHVPQVIQEETDWWWIIYPSHVPEQHPAFQNSEFITGGMATGPDGASPAFLIDDRWLVRKPPHLGSGTYSDVERRLYLPQWLQHEFFHHLFRTYPEFGLEATPHQWFNRALWPADFEGNYETDYFHEALVRRFQTASTPIHVALRYSTSDAPYDLLTINDVIGTYVREPVENPWHIGDIEFVAPFNGEIRWKNTANVNWGLDPSLSSGRLLTGPDCPYYDPPVGTEFRIVFSRDENGDLTDDISGFTFNGETYHKQ